MEITGKTEIVALIGHPVRHSPVPKLVNAVFEKLGLRLALVPFDVPAARLQDALMGARAMNLAGLAVSRPHKEAACALLDELGPTSTDVSSVDTVTNQFGRLRGHNTDLWSFLKVVKDEGGRSLRGKRVLLIGAGGTARAVTAALLREGVASLQVANRSADRAEQMLAQFGAKHPGVRLETVPFAPNDFRNAVRQADLLVNATPSDLETPQGPLLRQQDLHSALTVFDAIYSRNTPLLQAARRAGGQALSGHRMLLWQSAFMVKAWTGREAPIGLLERASEHAEPALAA